jgi:hypothetical protein
MPAAHDANVNCAQAGRQSVPPRILSCCGTANTTRRGTSPAPPRDLKAWPGGVVIGLAPLGRRFVSLLDPPLSCNQQSLVYVVHSS